MLTNENDSKNLILTWISFRMAGLQKEGKLQWSFSNQNDANSEPEVGGLDDMLQLLESGRFECEATLRLGEKRGGLIQLRPSK